MGSIGIEVIFLNEVLLVWIQGFLSPRSVTLSRAGIYSTLQSRVGCDRESTFWAVFSWFWIQSSISKTGYHTKAKDPSLFNLPIVKWNKQFQPRFELESSCPFSKMIIATQKGKEPPLALLFTLSWGRRNEILPFGKPYLCANPIL